MEGLKGSMTLLRGGKCVLVSTDIDSVVSVGQSTEISVGKLSDMVGIVVVAGF